MKHNSSIRALAVAAAGLLVPAALVLSAGPASAMPKSCLTMHIVYEQATLYSSHASATMTSFEDQAQINYSPDGTPQSVSGYYSTSVVTSCSTTT